MTARREPRAGRRRPPARLAFVVQEHRARALHWDFRLELDGVLRSWAVPRGPSMDPADRRLAVQVPDHPLRYAGFQGIIPPGHAGAGPVVVWDRGWWEPREPGDPKAALRAGKLGFVLHGRRLRGAFVLARMAGARGARGWLLIKQRDREAAPGWRIRSELTARRVAALRTRVPPCESA